MKILKISILAGCLMLQACGGSQSPAGTQLAHPNAGQLLQNPPPRLLSLSARDFTDELLQGGSAGQALLGLSTGDNTGKTALKCGVDVYYINFASVDGQNLPATSSGAIMVPTGGSGCSGSRPIIEYAHGTNFDHNYNIANLGDNTNPAYDEALMNAALYAANGYIVVAPNYVGYDSSTTAYHPYLVKQQQSADMINALKAARSALPLLLSPIVDNNKLFLTGYSQGGYVALATEQAMEQQNIPVTAAVPGSGPYALSAFVDYIFLGHPNLCTTRLGVILVDGYQGSYGNVYSNPADLFAGSPSVHIPYADAAADANSPVQLFSTPMFPTALPALASATILPSDPATLTTVKNNLAALGQSASAQPPANSTFSPFFWGNFLSTASASSYASSQAPLQHMYIGSNALINPTYWANYLVDALANMDNLFSSSTSTLPNAMPNTTPANPLRQDLLKNDLRGYVPQAPTLLCGGHADPMVFYPLNTSTMQAEWGAPTFTRLTLDVDNLTSNSLTPVSSLPTAIQPLATASQAVFAALYQGVLQANAGDVSKLLPYYHPVITAQTCALVGLQYFNQFL